MNRKSLISLTTAVLSIVMASGANAQEARVKPNSIGPAIEFSGGGTSFGIKGKIGVGSQFSVRPTVLFGYTPSVSNATFGQAITSGINVLTALVTPTRTQQIAAAKAADPTLNDTTAGLLLDKTNPTSADRAIIEKAQAPVPRYTQLSDAQLAAQFNAVSGPLTTQQSEEAAKQLVAALGNAQPTPEQQLSVDRAKDAIARFDIETFKKLTPEQQQTLVKNYLSPSTDGQQVANTVTALNNAVNKAAENRTSEDITLLATAQSTVRNNTNLPTFKDLNATQQRDLVQSFSQSPLTTAEVTARKNTLISLATAQQVSEDKRTEAQKTTITTANSLTSFVSNSLTPGFTPGTGTAYGVAVTYDFQSADSKLSGYFGPRVMFANGSSKIGNLDTTTNETSFGLLAGADYEIISDLTVGLSATYNFFKSGSLTVTGPGGFSGSALVSGSNLDIGVNVGYRF